MSKQLEPINTLIFDRVMCHFPMAYRPYAILARLDRPTGVWLLLWPCWWGLALATEGTPNVLLMAWLALGSIVMRGAGCCYNDIIDRDIDAQVARTRNRPLASGQITTRQGWLFIAGLLAVGLIILLPLTRLAVMVAVASIPLVALYPFMKRVTYWAQAWLGLTFNWGVLVGWAAVDGNLEPPAFVMITAGIFWTLGYDTIYAHQDKEDDALIGIKSTALKFGKNTKPWLFGFYFASMMAMVLAGHLSNLGLPFYGILVIAGTHFIWQASTVNVDDGVDCLAKFNSNKWFGAIVLTAIILGRLFDGFWII